MATKGTKELTTEQVEYIRSKWLAIGTNTEPANRAKAEEGIKEAYAAAGMAVPEVFFWYDSPLQAAMAITKAYSLDNIIESAKRMGVEKYQREMLTGVDVSGISENWWHASLYGQHWAGWLAHCEALEMQGDTDGMDVIHGVMKAAENLGWWWAFTEVDESGKDSTTVGSLVFATDRQSEIHFDTEDRLHSGTGPALAWRDGHALYAWHGLKVPKEAVTGEWSTDDILRQSNTEVRRAAIEIRGWDRFIEEADLNIAAGPVDDPGNPGQTLTLYDIPRQIYGEPVRVLLCANGTIEKDGSRRRFGLTVPAEISDPVEAAAWMEDDPNHPVRMTKELYSSMSRRC